MDMTGETTKTRKEDAEAVYEPKYAVARVAGFLNISVTSVSVDLDRKVKKLSILRANAGRAKAFERFFGQV
jgi:hypothetical protein